MRATIPLAEAHATAELLRALGDESRLRILALLRQGERCVCHITADLALSQPNASRHLGVLRHAGLVDSQRRGAWIYYRLAALGPQQARVLEAVLDGLPEESLAQDRAGAALGSCG